MISIRSSEITSYLYDPWSWYIGYVHGIKEETNNAMKRGVAIENALVSYLSDSIDWKEIEEEALDDEKTLSQYNQQSRHIPGIGKMIKDLHSGTPRLQYPINRQWDDETVLTGTVDILYDDQPFEIKSTMAFKVNPSKYVMQNALYRWMGGFKNPILIVFTCSGGLWYKYTDDELDLALQYCQTLIPKLKALRILSVRDFEAVYGKPKKLSGVHAKKYEELKNASS